ncbi:hypothetical protein [Mucilaginibacter sp.]|uniref:hypothetical protein n=1 Tax=Mucilaginibacter sp. TaxID=1882438 RepID=UPI0026186DB5|nr:hypothetical protein [Mucilaginibacter sp.]MDB4919844.1 hypothetical protein [Mucilaginibacter sp.]
MEFVRISEMLQIMGMKDEDGQPIPFKFRFDTCNLKDGTGGKRISMTDVILVGGAVSRSNTQNPGHFANYTRNFRSINNQEIRKFHPLLVEEFNDMRVIL